MNKTIANFTDTIHINNDFKDEIYVSIWKSGGHSMTKLTKEKAQEIVDALIEAINTLRSSDHV